MTVPRFYVLSGSSGGGKSTLLEALADEGYAVVREAGRELVREQQEIGSPIQPGTELFGELLQSRSMVLYNQALERYGTETTVFFDRSIMEPVAYYWSRGALAPHHQKLVERYRYADRVFMTPPWPEIFVQDAERRHGFDPEQKEYKRLCKAFPAFGYSMVELPKVSVEERLRFVLERVPA